jgi:hypothetical protein
MKGLLVVLSLSATALSAQGVTANLRGIKYLKAVTVNLIDGNGTGGCAEAGILAKTYGLLADPIRVETELRLREAGLPPDSGGPSAPVLQVWVTGCPGFVEVNLLLLELVQVRGQSIVAVTWQQGGDMFNYITSEKIRSAIRDQVSALVNQWLANNGPTVK